VAKDSNAFDFRKVNVKELEENHSLLSKIIMSMLNEPSLSLNEILLAENICLEKYLALQELYAQIDRKAADEVHKHTEEVFEKTNGKSRYEAWAILREHGIYVDPDELPDDGAYNSGCIVEGEELYDF